MWFSLFATVLILAVTFYQGLQGLFTALIACILTVLSAALAFGLYENVYAAFLVERQADFGRPVALMGIFIVTLLGLRALFDKLITGNMQFHVYVDRAGGGLFGLVTAMVVVGMLTISFQMLPFESNFMGFSRFVAVDKETNNPVTGVIDDWSKVKQVRQSTWLNSGGFTVNLVSYLSENALRGRPDQSFGEVYPDYLAYIYRAKANPLGSSRITADPDALKIVGYWDLRPNEFYLREHVKSNESKAMIRLKPALPPDAGYKRWAVRVSIDEKARDPDNQHRFTTEQSRLFAREKPDGPLKSYFPVGLSEDPAVNSPGARGRLVEIYPGEGFFRESAGPLQLDLVFLVPDRPEFKPVFLEYKVNARAEILLSPSLDKNKNHPLPLTGSKAGSKNAPPTEDGNTAPPPPRHQPNLPNNNSPSTDNNTSSTPPKLKDRVSGWDVRKGGDFSNLLPFDLTEYGGRDFEMGNGELRGGRIVVHLDNNWQPPKGGKQPIQRLQVPEGKYLLQLSVEKLQPQSWLGNIYGGVIDTIQNIYIFDASKNPIKPIGTYAMADVNGQKTFELILLDDIAREAGREVPKFEHIKKTDLQGEYALYFLFYVPSKMHPVGLHTGRTDQDLTQLNLVAP